MHFLSAGLCQIDTQNLPVQARSQNIYSLSKEFTFLSFLSQRLLSFHAPSPSFRSCLWAPDSGLALLSFLYNILGWNRPSSLGLKCTERRGWAHLNLIYILWLWYVWQCWAAMNEQADRFMYYQLQYPLPHSPQTAKAVAIALNINEMVAVDEDATLWSQDIEKLILNSLGNSLTGA